MILNPFSYLSRSSARIIFSCLPQQEAGLVLTDTKLMTGLPEYRNGGLLLDLGLLEAKHPGVTEQPHRPEEEVCKTRVPLITYATLTPLNCAR